jgi:hypothetical protein
VIFAGLPLAQLLAIFGAAAAVVVTFYILKLRRRTVAIPFSPLWQRILKDKEATSLFSKLKRLLSLLLQLALLALLVLALGDPRAAATLIKGRNLVVLIDASASMQATDVSPNRLAVAKDRVKQMIRGLGGSDRMLVAQMDAAVSPLGPMSGDTSELERTLDLIKPTDARADFPRALRFATDTLRGVENSEIVVVSDGDLGDANDASGAVHLGDTKLSYVPIGDMKNGNRNVAITEFSVRRYPLDKSRYEVMIEAANTGPEQEDVELTLLGDGEPVDITKLRLKPGERLPRFYPNLSGASRTLEAKIAPLDGSEDELPADNHAYALLPERRRAKVLVVTSGNTYLEAALLLDEYLDVTLTTPEKYVTKYAPLLASTSARPDVVIFDGVTPTELPKAHAFFIDPRGPSSPVKVGAELKDPGFDKLDRKHPVIRFTALDNVNIAKGHALKPEPGDKVVGASDDGPILIAGTRAGYKFVAMGFDLKDSDLPLRVAWPLLLLDSINWFTDEDAQYLSSFRTGDVWRIPIATSAASAKLKSPDGSVESVPVHEGRAVYLGERAGFYELTADDAAGASASNGSNAPAGSGTHVAFAANLLDEAESTIGPAKELNVDGKNAGSIAGFHVGVRREIWIYLLIIAAIVTAIEWATYHRRITV